ncbi:MAG: lipopolysaccharide heptosyltransferase I [Parachlamydiaceae bacterium]
MKILIVKTSSLGDIVHSFSALTFLRKAYPHAMIDWVVEQPFSTLLTAHPYVNRVITIDTKKWRKQPFSFPIWDEIKDFYQQLRQEYDVVFDLQGNSKSGLITACVRSKQKVGFGLRTVWEYPNLLFTNIKFNPQKDVNVCEEGKFLVKSYCQQDHQVDELILLKTTEEERHWLDHFFQDPLLHGKKKILIAPGSHWKNKQIDVKTLVQFLILLQQAETCCFIVTYGNESEKMIAEEIKKSLQSALLVEKLSLPLLQNLMAKMDSVIAMDSLPLHLAATTNTSTFGIFGPSAASKFAPEGSQHRFIQGACPYGKRFSRRCALLRSCSTGACIKKLTAPDLLRAYKEKSLVVLN